MHSSSPESIKFDIGTSPKSNYAPSDDWSEYSDSVLSSKHMTEKDKLNRTSTYALTAANVAKMYVGISLIAVSKSISQAGIYASILGFVYVCLINMYCVYILLKARNRFKKDQITDICDLTAKLYGEQYRNYMSSGLIFTNGIFLMAYVLYIGD